MPPSSSRVTADYIRSRFALAAQQGQRPRRRVLFGAWNSEERGLLGAWAYTEQPPAPITNIAGVLNMDMIGRNEEVPTTRRWKRSRG